MRRILLAVLLSASVAGAQETKRVTAQTVRVDGSSSPVTTYLAADFRNYTSTPATVPLAMNVEAGNAYAVSCRLGFDQGMVSGSGAITFDMAGGTATAAWSRFYTQVWDGAGTAPKGVGYQGWLATPVVASSITLPGIATIDGYLRATTSGTLGIRVRGPASNYFAQALKGGMAVTSGNPGKIFVTTGTTAANEPFVSTDAGATWSKVHHLRGVTSFAASPSDPNIVYAGAAYVQGSEASTNRFAVSVDGGVTWAAQPNGNLSAVPTMIAVHPTNPAIVYAVSSTGKLVWRSTDSGATWTSKITGLSGTSAAWLAIDPVTPTNLYLAISSSVYKSTDSGDNWTATGAASLGTVAFVEVDPATPTRIYAGGSTGDSFYVSTDSGTSWTNSASGLEGDALVALAIDAKATPPKLYLGTAAVFASSTDSGATWTDIGGAFSSASAALRTNPTTGTLFVSLNGNGKFYRLGSDGITWSSELGFLPVTIQSGSHCTLERIP